MVFWGVSVCVCVCVHVYACKLRCLSAFSFFTPPSIASSKIVDRTDATRHYSTTDTPYRVSK